MAKIQGRRHKKSGLKSVKRRGKKVRGAGVLEELWTEVHNITQEVVIKTIPQKINSKRQYGCKRRPYK